MHTQEVTFCANIAVQPPFFKPETQTISIIITKCQKVSNFLFLLYCDKNTPGNSVLTVWELSRLVMVSF